MRHTHTIRGETKKSFMFHSRVDVIAYIFMERVTGISRDSNARRRSHLVWAPPHKNFLLKILAPAFDFYYQAS